MSTAVPRSALRTIVASVLALPESHVIWDGEPVPFVAAGALLVLDVLARRAVGVGLSFTDATNVQPLPATVDNRAISVAQIDVTFNEAVEKVVDVLSAGYIESVEMTGEGELAGTFEVSDRDD